MLKDKFFISDIEQISFLGIVATTSALGLVL
jgi:hypothetical protein